MLAPAIDPKGSGRWSALMTQIGKISLELQVVSGSNSGAFHVFVTVMAVTVHVFHAGFDLE